MYSRTPSTTGRLARRALRRGARSVAALTALTAVAIVVPAREAGAQTAGGAGIDAPVGLGPPAMGVDITNDGVVGEAGNRTVGTPPYYDNTRWYTVVGDGSVYFVAMRQDIVADDWDGGNATLELWVANGNGTYTLFYEGHNTYHGGGWLFAGDLALAGGTTYYLAVGSVDVSDNGGIDVAFDDFDPGVMTTTALGSTPASPTMDDTLTLTATVGGVTNGGTVQFLDDGAAIAGAEAVAVTGGTASFDITDPTVGAHSYSAVYSGGGGYARSVTSTGHAVSVAATAPDAPTNAAATAGDAEAGITWDAPADDGGSAITAYTVACASATPGDCSGISDVTTLDGATTTATVTGLTNGTTYTFTVAATNGAGTSPASTATPAVTPAAGPGPPTTKTPQTIAFGTLPEVLLLGQAPLEVPVSATSGLAVSIAASGACTASAGRVVPSSVGTCTIVANQAGGTTYAAAPETVASLPVAAASDTTLVVGSSLGGRADGAPITYRATGLMPGTPVTLTLFSAPVRLASVTVPARGSVIINTAIPSGVDPGAHELVASGTAADGTPRTDTLALEIAADRALVRIGNDALPTLAATGSEAVRLVPFALAAIVAGAWLTTLARRRDRAAS